MKHPVKAILLAVALAYSGISGAAELTSDKQKFSYAMGVNLGNLLKSQGIGDIDSAAFSTALEDVLSGNALKLDLATMKQAIEKQQDKILKQLAGAAEQKKQQGIAFLEKNKSADGVTVLPNGMQYIVLKAGSGKQPVATDKVTVHYHGTLIDGTVFDSSVERGATATFSLDSVIPGFRESLIRMKTGGKWRVFVPSDLAYGENGAGNSIGPNETLIFEIELIKIN